LGNSFLLEAAGTTRYQIACGTYRTGEHSSCRATRPFLFKLCFPGSLQVRFGRSSGGHLRRRSPSTRCRSGPQFPLQGKGPRPRVGANLTLCSSLPEDLFAPKDGSLPVVQSSSRLSGKKKPRSRPSPTDVINLCPMTWGQPEHGNPLKRSGSVAGCAMFLTGRF
jgi:hypothetical protein